MDPQRSRKKMLAAIAAVVQHISELEVAAAAAAPAAPAPPPVPPPNLWAVAGRQDGMLLRSLWQRRVSKSW